MTPSGRAHKKGSTPPSYGKKWVETTLRKMSLRQKLGQLLMVPCFGEFTSTESGEYKRLVRQVQENHVGGFIIEARRTPRGIERSRVYPTAVLLNQLQRLTKVPLLVGADCEAGAAMRLDEATAFPSAMAVAATGDPRNAYAIGKIAASEARAAGVHLIFAPVADVNNNPENPIINIRSFGEDPRRVAEFVTQFVRGVEENGALATAKHFPGHGDVDVDSHLSLAVVPGDRQRLESVELVPFCAAIAAGASAVMSGHLAVPAFEPDPNLPASLSEKILTGLLRKELGFRGLTVSDALDMEGVTSNYAPGEIAVRAVAAGTDLLLFPPDPEASLAALENAIRQGRLPMERIDDAVRHILQAKAKLGLQNNRLVDIDGLSERFAPPEFSRRAQEIADRGVTLLRDRARLFPLDATRPLRLLLVVVSADPDPYPGLALENEIRWRVDSLDVLRADTSFVKVRTLTLPSPESYDLAVAALFVRVADRKGNVGLPDEEAAFVERLLANGKPVVVACLGSPYLIERFPAAPTWLAAFATQSVAQRAVARALFGQIAVEGRIPVTVPGVAKLGDALRVAANPMILASASASRGSRLKAAFDALDRAVAERAFPGGVLAVGRDSELVVHPFGRLAYDASSPRVVTNTIYDVASLTKPVVTATAVMMLAATKRLDLDAPVKRYLPEWAQGPNPDWRKKVTLRELLLHTSGLPAHRAYYKDTKGRRAFIEQVSTEPLVAEPGTRVEYSDLGFMLLGEIIERLTGTPLDRYAREQIFAPLGMNDSLFNPPKNLRARIAPTEDDTAFRKRRLQGEVDDANALAMGGVAGHAGLFSTGSDLAAFAQMLLNGGIYAHRRLLSRAMIQQFTRRHAIGASARALGWDVPTEPSSTGRAFSPHSFGHLGYTGVSLWVDPEKKLFVILLTNRVHPTAANDKIREVRPVVHDAIVEALGLVPERAASR
jgi:beta-N-acetylhexosaminidase